jgi:UDP-glucose 4-epimerase
VILITGTSGFIGKHLLHAAVEKYGKENIIALTSKPLKEYNYLLHNNYQFKADFFSKNDYNGIDTVIHAGAYTPKNGKEANRINACNQNIAFTEKLLDARLPGLKKIIYLSTLDVYGEDAVITESTVVSPLSFYGYSKYYCEKMIEFFCKEKNIQCCILRVGHVYGPGEEAYSKVIPNTIKKIIAGEQIEIFGTGEDKRAFIYIKDAVTAIINSIESINDIGVVNLVSRNSISIKELVIKIISLSATNTEIIYKENPLPSRNLVFDSSKMERYLLEKETGLDSGLKEEIEYMKKSYSK